jgi:hypothetical protein
MQRALSLVRRITVRLGVFCGIYSVSAPHFTAQAPILLLAALAVSYFTTEYRTEGAGDPLRLRWQRLLGTVRLYLMSTRGVN